MSNVEFQNQEKIDLLPKEGVHCFAANAKQIKKRRILTVILMVLFAFITVYLTVLAEVKSYTLGIFTGIVFVIFLLVFIQSFLIAKYRVAVDYNEKRVVLRYRFTLVEIPFDSFDARDGEADKADELMQNITHKALRYLVLDNVFEDACYQTSNKDLASNEDFDQLRAETLAIADAYGAKNSEGAILPIGMVKDKDGDENSEENIDKIVDSVMDGSIVDDKNIKEENTDETV